MAGGAQRFRRAVIGMHPRMPRQGMTLAVDLAVLLQLELHGLFVEEAGLLGLAGLPFARELRPLGGWRPLEASGLAEDLQLLARASERLFAEATRRLERASRFEVVRGSTAEALGAVSRSGDILVIVEPASPAEQATLQFSAMMSAAFRSRAAVLLVPPRLARRTGPVVALADATDDPAVAAAADIAAAAGEKLVVRAMAGALAPGSWPVGERLVVVTRGSFDDAVAPALASRRAVPVLVVEPESS